MNDLIPTDQFFELVLQDIRILGGLSWTLKIATLITLIISSMKVSFLQPYWSKLGWAKSIMGPLLGLIAGILMLSQNNALTVTAASAYVFSGAGAIILHELLDGLKLIPGVGPAYISVINFFERVLASPSQSGSVCNK